MNRPLRIVLVGLGPVGVRFAEELLPHVAAGTIALTVVDAEHDEPYNRIMVAEYAVGEVERDHLVIADTAELTAAGVDVRLSARVVRIDREATALILSDGSTVAYDRLVLATGARANVPVLDGLERLTDDAGMLDDTLTRGVCVLRSAHDARHVRDAVARGGSVVVLGAGVLGIELALALARAGARPTVAHFGPIPMPRQLDRSAAAVLAGALEDAGVHVVPHVRAEAIVATADGDGERRFRALVSSDGKRLDADLLVLSCGVTARTELARDAGLRVDAGVLVDAELRSWSDPRIFAIGDCAHVGDPDAYLHEPKVPGGPSGLVGPGWRQAEWLATRMAADLDAAAHDDLDAEAPGIVMLKGDVDLVSAGDVSPEPFQPVPRGERAPGIAVWADPEHGTYTKIVSEDGVLTGFVSVGMPRAAAELSLLYARRGELPADRTLLLRLDAADPAPRPTGRDAIVCLCNTVTAGTIDDAVHDGCDTVAEVGRCTRAGTGCGGCRSRIAELIGAGARESVGA